jgi:hypothetical protein
MLNLNDILRDLRWELEKINQAITMLEHIPANPTPSGRRGRKSMGQEERAEVSKRMKTYWANRRLSRTA